MPAGNWRNRVGSEVLHKDLWQTLNELHEALDVTWKKVEGHLGVPGVQRAGAIARDYSVRRFPRLFSGREEDYGHDLRRLDHRPREVAADRGR